MSDPQTETIIEAISHFAPESEDWGRLDALVESLWATGEPEKGTEALFGVFERFPNDDGFGVFWSILHGLESLPTYESALVASLRRQPTEFTVLMVNRILNVGQTSIGGADGPALLRDVLAHPNATPQAKQDAKGYLERYPPSV